MKKNCIICKKNLITLKKKFLHISSDIEPLKHNTKYSACLSCLYVKKIINKKYLNNIKLIYSKYRAHAKFKLKDQKKISSQKDMDRCELVYQKFIKKFKVKYLLDFGSGNGAMIYPFLKSKTKIFANDFANNVDQKIKKNNNFKFLDDKDLKKTKTKFDLITLNHVFEHLINPVETLNQLKEKLHKNGKIFIQIPDYYNNPFDLIIYDHSYHHSILSIKKIANLCKLNVRVINNTHLFGEITVILQKSNLINSFKIKKLNNLIYEKFSFLEKKIKEIKLLNNFSLLGSSISSLWIFYNFKKKVKNIYDEDRNKIGKFFFGKKIKSLSNLKKNDLLVLPFYGKKKIQINKRLKKIAELKNVRLL